MNYGDPLCAPQDLSLSRTKPASAGYAAHQGAAHRGTNSSSFRLTGAFRGANQANHRLFIAIICSLPSTFDLLVGTR